jgi:hypothetical protein
MNLREPNPNTFDYRVLRQKLILGAIILTLGILLYGSMLAMDAGDARSLAEFQQLDKASVSKVEVYYQEGLADPEKLLEFNSPQDIVAIEGLVTALNTLRKGFSTREDFNGHKLLISLVMLGDERVVISLHQGSECSGVITTQVIQSTAPGFQVYSPAKSDSDLEDWLRQIEIYGNLGCK